MRESEIISLKQTLDEERMTAEKQLQEHRHKALNQLETLQDEIENVKRQKAQMEKTRGNLESENRELMEEVKVRETAYSKCYII